MSSRDRFDKLLGALADPYRRELLLALTEHNPQDDADSDPLNIHPEGEDEFSQLNIFMGHLPQLDEMGIIDWNQDEDEITKGPDWKEFEPLLRLIAENKDELPKAWFENANDD
jgi:hypothetical protein